MSEDKFVPELCIDLTLLSYVVCSSASTSLFASSFKTSNACLDSINPSLLKLSFRGGPHGRHVATHPKELSNTCERLHDFTSVLTSSPDKPADVPGVS